MGFSRQGYWSGLPCPPPGDLPNPGVEPRSRALQEDLDSYHLSHQGSLFKVYSLLFWYMCEIITTIKPINILVTSTEFSSVQSLSCVQLIATPWTATCQASLSITNSWSLLKLMSIKSVIPSNHLILCHPLLLLPSSLSLFMCVLRRFKLRCILWKFQGYNTE